MTKTLPSRSNYLDPDVAYLLGLIVGRGSITDSGDNRRLVIDFPFRALQAEGLKKRYDQKIYLTAAVNQIRIRIEQLLEASVEVNQTRSNVQFVARFMRNTMTWRNILLITEGGHSFRDSTVPQRIFEAPQDIQKEFVRGLADVCGFVRKSNDHYGRYRVYIEVPAENWKLPTALCRLLQVNLGVPVHLIQWNHPNTRIPNMTKQKLTGREHQVKIYAEAFLPIGFYVEYKQAILDELAEANMKAYPKTHACNPNPALHRDKRKPKHPEEKCKLIPKTIRGKHFESYWQICTALGCNQFREIDPHQQKLFQPQGKVDDGEDTE